MCISAHPVCSSVKSNGVRHSVSILFKNNYVFVWVNGIELNQGLAAGQYTVRAGAGSPSGGTITLVDPSINGDIVTIEGIMPIDRTSNLFCDDIESYRLRLEPRRL